MLRYPQPVRRAVVVREMAKRGHFEPQFQVDEAVQINDFMFRDADGFVFIDPRKLARRLSRFERAKVIRNKLQFLLQRVHRDGFLMERVNVEKFFALWIGWRPDAADVDVVYCWLGAHTPQFP